ncbi:MAG: V-type ATP synthase subunit E family protein [candidate division WOR-3 bacterium]|nr:V-type ATP synthase subunit E family protein [candidate division WOR-3 bacterium]
MSIEKLTSTIIESAQQKAQAIKEKYEQEIAKLKKATDEQIIRLTQENNEKIARQESLLEMQLISNAQLTAQKEILQVKWAIIDQVFNQAIEKFVSSDKYYQILTEIIKKHADNDSEIIVASQDYPQLQKLMPNIKLIPNENFNRGIIIKKSRIELNYSLDRIVKSLKSDLIVELSKLLFTE